MTVWGPLGIFIDGTEIDTANIVENWTDVITLFTLFNNFWQSKTTLFNNFWQSKTTLFNKI